jgi:hypothetical protein
MCVNFRDPNKATCTIPPTPPTKCATYFQELKCFKEFSATTPFTYKLVFHETNLNINEMPYIWIALEKDNMDLALKQETTLANISIQNLEVMNV